MFRRFRFAFLATVLMCLVFNLPSYAVEKNAMPSASGIYDALTKTPDWLNTLRPLVSEDLKGRIILIDFWTYCCINCIHVIPKLHQLEQEFGNKLTVIGIHSAKFTNEGETANIREAIQKYGIEHPVVNDADFRIWNSFGARAWPTLALIGPDGLMKKVYRDEGDVDEMRSDIQALIAKSGSKLVTEPLPIALEKEKIPPTVLQFPTKLTPFDDTHLVIADSGHQRIVVANAETGVIILSIGSGVKGYRDGDFTTAQFNDPHGVLVDGDMIYVADTGNHRLRAIDIKAGTVSTIAGTGERGGYLLIGNHNALRTSLASPWDLAFYPDNNTIAIANAGSHQLWAYDIARKTLRIIAGNGQESIDDGRLPLNSLSQPSGLSVGAEGLYLVDSETSALRVFKDKTLTTLIGTGLFDFGLKDGDKQTALMQHAIGVHVDTHNGQDRVYIADTYNHAIRLYRKGELTTLVSDDLKEPNGVTRLGDTLYITDTNNHRIKRMDDTGVVLGILDIMPEEKPIAYQEFLPNAVTLPAATVAPKAEVSVTLPEGWKINEEAPSYVAVFDAAHKPVRHITRDDLRSGTALLDVLPGRYTLQGMIYYCQKKDGALCLIRGIQGDVDVQDSAERLMSLPVTP